MASNIDKLKAWLGDCDSVEADYKFLMTPYPGRLAIYSPPMHLSLDEDAKFKKEICLVCDSQYKSLVMQHHDHDSHCGDEAT